MFEGCFYDGQFNDGSGGGLLSVRLAFLERFDGGDKGVCCIRDIVIERPPRKYTLNR